MATRVWRWLTNSSVTNCGTPVGAMQSSFNAFAIIELLVPRLRARIATSAAPLASNLELFIAGKLDPIKDSKTSKDGGNDGDAHDPRRPRTGALAARLVGQGRAQGRAVGARQRMYIKESQLLSST